MTADKLKNRISSMATHVTFEYMGVDCGVDPLSQTRFDMWFGDEVMVAESIDQVMGTPFFEGRTLKDIAPDITIIDW